MRPFININGDTRETLISQQNKIRHAATALLVALCESSPHGRNYPGADERYAMDREALDYDIRTVRRLIEETERNLLFLVGEE